jgi:hypothetical protein
MPANASDGARRQRLLRAGRMTMPCEPANAASRDVLASWWQSILLYCLPVAAIVVTASPASGGMLRTAVWTIACAVIGVACLFNARRCGRIHCYFTGPFFLVMALVALLYGKGMLPLGARGWSDIGIALVAGGIVLGCLPELFFGKYRVPRR